MYQAMFRKAILVQFAMTRCVLIRRSNGFR